jgi:large subunit ribosomal protein L15
MQLHEIKRDHPLKKKKRVGRGGKKGTYSGKGMKGQSARAGAKIRPALRDIVKKFPKQRGYQFGPAKGKPVIVNLEALEKHFADGEKVNCATLRKHKIIRKKDKEVKILGKGSLTKKLTFEGYIVFSKTAKAIIEKIGGKIETKKRIKSTLPKAEREKLKKAKKLAEKGNKIEKPNDKKDDKKEKKDTDKKKEKKVDNKKPEKKEKTKESKPEKKDK